MRLCRVHVQIVRGSLRRRTQTAMHNEVLCKIFCYNLEVLILHEMYKQDIEPLFWAEGRDPKTSTQK